jgi:hypothetical protein
MDSKCVVSLFSPNSLQLMVRQAIRHAHGREQGRTTHHPEHGRRTLYLPEQLLLAYNNATMFTCLEQGHDHKAIHVLFEFIRVYAAARYI